MGGIKSFSSSAFLIYMCIYKDREIKQSCKIEIAVHTQYLQEGTLFFSFFKMQIYASSSL